MANLLGSSLFTGAISGLNANYLLLANGQDGLTLEGLLNPSDNTLKYTVNQTFRSYSRSVWHFFIFAQCCFRCCFTRMTAFGVMQRVKSTHHCCWRRFPDSACMRC